MTWLLDGRPVERILVSRLRYLGDVVMSTVVVDALRRGDGALEIGYLCEAAHAPVLDGQPYLARVHGLAARRRGGDARARKADAADGLRALGTLATVGALRAARYDTAVDLFFNPRSAWLLRLAGVPRRLAGPAGSRGRLYTHQSDTVGAEAGAAWSALAPGGLGAHLSRLAPLVHAESGLGFVAWFTREQVPALPRLGPRPQAPARVAAQLRAAGLPGDVPFVVLAQGATWASKRWPSPHWGALAAGLLERWPGSVVALTPPGEDGAADAGVRPVPGRLAVLPPVPLPTALDLLATAALVVSVDGGIMHAAVGLGAPTLALFGPTDPRLWFPYAADPRFRVLAERPPCHPCDRHACDAFICLPGLPPAAVLGAASSLLAAHEARPGGSIA